MICVWERIIGDWELEVSCLVLVFIMIYSLGFIHTTLKSLKTIKQIKTWWVDWGGVLLVSSISSDTNSLSSPSSVGSSRSERSYLIETSNLHSISKWGRWEWRERGRAEEGKLWAKCIVCEKNIFSITKYLKKSLLLFIWLIILGIGFFWNKFLESPMK